jgi:hypothetical protein
MSSEQDSPDAFAGFRQFFALKPDVLVLSVAMFGFALAFQTTRQYILGPDSVNASVCTIIGSYESESLARGHAHA